MRNTKNFTPKRLIKAAPALLLALALAACGGSGSAAQPTPAATEQPAATAEIAESGGQLLVYLPMNVGSYDPLLAGTKELQGLLSLVYEPLLQYDSTCRLSASLAETWSTDDNGVTWKIGLRRSVRWQGSGDAFTARDVLYTVGLLRSEAYADSVYAPLLDKIADITAVDEYTLVVTGAEPGMSALYALTFPIVSEKNFTRNAGTGPYVIEYADEAEGMELSVNSNWWKKPPYITTVIAQCAPDVESALSLMEIRQMNYVPTSLLTASTYREEGVTSLLETNTQHSEILYLNHASWRLQDVRVRQAIAYALDRRDVISKAYYNHAFACDVPVPPDSWLYDPTSKIYDTDVAKARDLLEDAGWADYDEDGVLDKREGDSISRMRLTLLVNDTPDNQVRKDVAALIKARLALVGIEVEINAVSWTAQNNDYQKALESGGFDMALAGVNLDRSFDLTPFVGTGGAKNYGKYSSSAMDALLAQARTVSSESGLKEIMAQVQQKFVEDLPFIHLYLRTYSIAYSSDLRITSDIRDTNPYQSIEKWYFTAAGRNIFSGNEFEGEHTTPPPLIVTPVQTPGEEGEPGETGGEE